MEMSNNFMPELHVAQQRRRDKLRVQHLDELQHLNNSHHHQQHHHHHHHNTSNSNASSLLLPSPEMLSFASASNSYHNIHPTRFITPSSESLPPSCDDSWVQRPAVPQFHEIDFESNNDNNSGNGNTNNNDVQSWGNELPLLPPNFVSHHQSSDVGSQGLNLSLSSNQLCEYHHLSGGGGDFRELKPFESGSILSVVKQSMSNDVGKLECRNDGNTNNNEVNDVAGSSIQVHRPVVGPLGPFTGYAAILKSSKFLKPAQLMLDEFFAAAGIWRGGELVEDDQSLSISRSRNVGDCTMRMDGSNELSCRSSSCESYRPDCHERKAKLLHMQEEVCKQHKQYNQQMQMVMSAFDSVPGLSNATPYISRSIKTISKHFRCLKNAIADQLKHIKRALGEDLTSPTSFLKGDSSTSLRYDQNYAKVRSGAIGGTSHLGHQSHVWRPQRGLPERAVSVLRAWLFDHFLHPYPTDNDKQMLATQTGLTRNQVSNWFINARVRLWKPMVEEIHMLETKGPSRSEPISDNSVMSIVDKNRQAATAAANKSACKPTHLNPACDRQLECLGPSSSLERSRGETINTEQLFHSQKCSRLESHQVPTSIDSSFIGFLPYQRRGLELGGIGAVSLTLGLRHGSETTQQQLQHQYIPQGIPFGGHVIHDFSG